MRWPTMLHSMVIVWLCWLFYAAHCSPNWMNGFAAGALVQAKTTHSGFYVTCSSCKVMVTKPQKWNCCCCCTVVGEEEGGIEPTAICGV